MRCVSGWLWLGCVRDHNAVDHVGVTHRHLRPSRPLCHKRPLSVVLVGRLLREEWLVLGGLDDVDRLQLGD